ncbi:hypothetical protein WOLCODRAFT_86126, partial [Wolfiporia cocos MD-104 SS10]
AEWLEKKKDAWDMAKMSMAWAEMVLRVSGGQLVHMVSHNPMVCWAMLVEVHQAHGFTTWLVMWQRFYCAMKDVKKSMGTWIG